MGVVIFNGRSSLDYKVQVETQPDYTIPARDYEIIHIPGRNGDLMMDRGSYQNITGTYKIAAYSKHDNFEALAKGISSWLHSTSTYAILEDSYDPEIFRMGVYKDELNIENIFGKAGRCALNFYCKPQRFLKSGTKKKTFKGTTVLNNPTGYPAKPLITVYGNGDVTLQVGIYPITIKNLNGFITIDSDIQDCYKGLINENQKVTLPVGFPVLNHRRNKISWTTSGISSVEVTPRWWEL